MRKLELFEVAQWLHQYEQYREKWFVHNPRRGGDQELNLLTGALWFTSPEHHKLSRETFGIQHASTVEQLLDLIVEPEYHQDIKNALYANGYQAPVL